MVEFWSYPIPDPGILMEDILGLPAEGWRLTGSGLERYDEPRSSAIDALRLMVERDIGKIGNWWATRHQPGARSVFLHGHNTPTLIYYPGETDVPLLLGNEMDVFIPEPGEVVFMDAGYLHGIGANKTDDTRYSLVFTKESRE